MLCPQNYSDTTQENTHWGENHVNAASGKNAVIVKSVFLLYILNYSIDCFQLIDWLFSIDWLIINIEYLRKHTEEKPYIS